MKKTMFRLMLITASVFFMSFTTFSGNTERRFWGWGCPSCSPTIGGSAGELTCVSTYYVLGIGVNTETCICNNFYSPPCTDCNNSNLDCGSEQ